MHRKRPVEDRVRHFVQPFGPLRGCVRRQNVLQRRLHQEKVQRDKQDRPDCDAGRDPCAEPADGGEIPELPYPLGNCHVDDADYRAGQHVQRKPKVDRRPFRAHSKRHAYHFIERPRRQAELRSSSQYKPKDGPRRAQPQGGAQPCRACKGRLGINLRCHVIISQIEYLRFYNVKPLKGCNSNANSIAFARIACFLCK